MFARTEEADRAYSSRISLISKRDIRYTITLQLTLLFPGRLHVHSYVGTLHEISSENSTVALEQVVSFGTEGRRPEDEVPPSDNVYEYIVFRGSDVKDLRIEDTPKENKPPQPQVPDDPAILGVSAVAGYVCCLWTRSCEPEIMMKNFGCKSYILNTESANPMWRFSVAFLLIFPTRLLMITSQNMCDS